MSRSYHYIIQSETPVRKENANRLSELNLFQSNELTCYAHTLFFILLSHRQMMAALAKRNEMNIKS